MQGPTDRGSSGVEAGAWLNSRPVFWTVVIAVALVGAVYFVLVQRTKPAHLQAPEGELFADVPPAAAAPTT